MRDGYLPLVCKAAVISIVLLLTGCGGNYSETEFHPSGEISEKLEEGTRVLYDYDAEDKSQTLYFGSCGGGRLDVYKRQVQNARVLSRDSWRSLVNNK